MLLAVSLLARKKRRTSQDRFIEVIDATDKTDAVRKDIKRDLAEHEEEARAKLEEIDDDAKAERQTTSELSGLSGELNRRFDARK